MTSNLVIRTAEERDIDDVAALRRVWAPPADPDQPAAEFAAFLSDWMTAHRDDILCKIAVLDGRLIGMAWLALYERVPNPDDRNRRTGDLQSVFVLPEHRGRGIGTQLVSAVCRAADELGIRSVTVWSSAAASALYSRLGFARRDLLLERHSTPPGTATRSART